MKKNKFVSFSSQLHFITIIFFFCLAYSMSIVAKEVPLNTLKLCNAPLKCEEVISTRANYLSFNEYLNVEAESPNSSSELNVKNKSVAKYSKERLENF